MLAAKDVSRYQGNWSDTGEPIVMVKISGGDAGLYVDVDAAENYNKVIAEHHGFGGYHFAGGGNPQTEAKYYLNAMLPWNRGEVPALDVESGKSWNPNGAGVDPVAWSLAFIEQVEASTGNPGGLIYMNLNTLNLHDWSPVLAKWGLWLADWDNDPTGATVPTNKTVVMLQYADGPVYDHDEWYGTIEAFHKYGWLGTPAVVPTPVPTPPSAPPVPAPSPVPEPTPPVQPDPLPVPTPPAEPVTNPVPDPTPVDGGTTSTSPISTPVPPLTNPTTPPTKVIVSVSDEEKSVLRKIIQWFKNLFKEK